MAGHRWSINVRALTQSIPSTRSLLPNGKGEERPRRELSREWGRRTIKGERGEEGEKAQKVYRHGLDLALLGRGPGLRGGRRIGQPHAQPHGRRGERPAQRRKLALLQRRVRFKPQIEAAIYDVSLENIINGTSMFTSCWTRPLTSSNFHEHLKSSRVQLSRGRGQGGVSREMHAFDPNSQ